MEYGFIYPTVLGNVGLVEHNGRLTRLMFDVTKPVDFVLQETPLLHEAATQLTAYFAGSCFCFELPLLPRGSIFQQAVWQALQTIPYGETRTYGEIAAQIGSPAAYRAVGMANHNNPLAIFIPCHRVIGKNKKLVGYRGGLGRKMFLLDLEKQRQTT